MTVGEITDSIRKKVKGEMATKLDKGDQQVDIIVKASEKDRSTLRDLNMLAINLPSGGTTPLKSVADVIPSRGPGSITRVGNSRVALVTANLSQRTLGEVVGDIKEKFKKMELPGGTFFRITGQNEEMQRSLKSLYLAIFLAVCLVYIVLAIQFESLLHPFIIMFCVPYSLVGLALLMYLTGTSINVFSLIGMMMMFGIAVNDAIVMITTINLRRASGMERMEAVVEGARTRLRPIMITTLTTVLGMIPMALPVGEGAELRNPLAIAVIGGILSSTFFTLFAIPATYLVIDRLGSILIPERGGQENQAP
jgi:HAE1 family hydrophobic/amphiphilic exporter-1